VASIVIEMYSISECTPHTQALAHAHRKTHSLTHSLTRTRT
jgi:hypothetical protein